MSESTSLLRRRFLQTAAASLGLGAVVRPSLAGAYLPRAYVPPLADSPDLEIAIAARSGLERAGARVAYRDVVAVADFREASRTPRLHLVDMTSGRIESLLVAHGRGSDPEHTGWLSRFSNDPGSEATSEGNYVTGDYYVGEHGRSMRLIGLDPTNSNAESRAIVVHAAWYVAPEMIQTRGMLGRSEGCFAVSDADLPTMLERLSPGHLLVAGIV